jgi:AcrR family transcriptional regulator
VSAAAKLSDRRAAAHRLQREHLLDAAGELTRTAAWPEISMDAVARRAGVSRQTLYNEFGSRESFAAAFALRVTDNFLTEVERGFDDASLDPVRALETGFRRFLELASSDPVVRTIVLRGPGAEELLALFTVRGGPVLELARERLAGKMLKLWPEADPAAARILAEALVRLGISHAGLPAVCAEDAVWQVKMLLTPFIAVHLPA